VPADASVASVRNDDTRLVMTARQLRRMREARVRHLSEAGDAEPAWDLLLALYTTESTQARSSDLAAAARLPQTTAFRWLVEMERIGLVSRRVDPSDRRAVQVRLTEQGRAGVIATLAAMSVGPAS
jgi:DNA-binding MarR family transcriptional regulator